MSFPQTRLRRLRRTASLRALMQETVLTSHDLVQPLFVRPGRNQRKPISSMPGQYQLSVDALLKEAETLMTAGVPAVILFGIPARKDLRGSAAHQRTGIVPRAVRALKKEFPGLVVITDVCLCAYTNHGHCGIVRQDGQQYHIENDATLPLLGRMAVAHADAGADIVAPSDMMDGRIAAIRSALDRAGHADIPLLSYAAKFASAFYGPFRDAAESSPQFGDRRSYQMSPGNGEEALREVALDLEEGADLVMIKPGLPYLDLVRQVKQRFSCPVAVYNVSGEYAMVKAAAQQKYLDEQAVVMEMMTAFKRAGASLILTYWAKDVARWMRDQKF